MNVSKRILSFSLLTGFVLIFSVFSCSNKKSIEMAYIAPLSGTNSLLGLESRDGFEIALSELYGKDIELKISYYDDQGDSATNLDIVKSVIDQGIKLIVFNSTSGASIQGIKYASDQKVFCFSTTVSSAELAGKKDYFFRTANSNSFFGAVMADITIKHSPNNKPGKVVSIGDTSNGNYANTINSNFNKAFSDKGLPPVVIQSFNGNSDFSSNEVAKKILKENPDWVLIIANPLTSANIAQNIRKLGSKAQICLSPFGANTEFIRQGGPEVEGSFVFSTTLFEKNSNYLDFAEKYRQKAGKAPSYYAQFGYDTAWMLHQIFSSINDINPETLLAYLDGGKTLTGLTNSITIDDMGDALSNFYIYIVKNGIFEKIDN